MQRLPQSSTSGRRCRFAMYNDCCHITVLRSGTTVLLQFVKQAVKDLIGLPSNAVANHIGQPTVANSFTATILTVDNPVSAEPACPLNSWARLRYAESCIFRNSQSQRRGRKSIDEPSVTVLQHRRSMPGIAVTNCGICWTDSECCEGHPGRIGNAHRYLQSAAPAKRKPPSHASTISNSGIGQRTTSVT